MSTSRQAFPSNWLTALAAIYGASMGLFARSSDNPDAVFQIIASSLKLPALFLLTLLVTFPALYVFSALSRSRSGFVALLRLLMVSIVVMVAVSASFAPILAFFTLSTTSYSFMVLLNVALLGTAGLIGLGFLRRALEVLIHAVDTEPAPPPPPPAESSALADFAQVLAAERAPARILASRPPAIRVFRVWLADLRARGGADELALAAFHRPARSPFHLVSASPRQLLSIRLRAPREVLRGVTCRVRRLRPNDGCSSSGRAARDARALF